MQNVLYGLGAPHVHMFGIVPCLLLIVGKCWLIRFILPTTLCMICVVIDALGAAGTKLAFSLRSDRTDHLGLTLSRISQLVTSMIYVFGTAVFTARWFWQRRRYRKTGGLQGSNPTAAFVDILLGVLSTNGLSSIVSGACLCAAIRPSVDVRFNAAIKIVKGLGWAGSPIFACIFGKESRSINF